MRNQRCIVLFVICSVAIKPLLGSFIGGLFTSLTGGNTNPPPTKPTISTPSKSNHGFVQRNPEEQFLQDIAQDRFLQPPLNPEYAAKLRLLSTLPLNQRLAYIKAGLLRTGSRPLQQLGNLFTQNANQYRNQANELYPSRPAAPPASPRPGSLPGGLGGINPRNPLQQQNQLQNLRPGQVESINTPDLGLIRLTNPNPIRNLDPGLTNNDPSLTFGSLQDMITKQKLLAHQQRLQEINRGPAKQVSGGFQTSQTRAPFAQQNLVETSTCNERLGQLVGDIFIGHEMIPQVLDLPPDYPLELTYRTVRTFPGMRLTAEATRFNPMMHWPSEQGVLYTIVISNIDINSRRNRTLSEFWHWFVANVPGNSIDDGQEIFQLLHPLVLPEGSGDHRFGYFVMKQPSFLDYTAEGGPTDNCSPLMSAGRGPFRSTKDFIKKYGLRLVAATFLIIDSSQASVEIACEWQACMGGEVFLKDLDCELASPRQFQERRLLNNKKRR